MAEEAPAPAPDKAQAKPAKKKAAPRPKKYGPKWSLVKLLIVAVSNSKDRKGVSAAACKKALAAAGYDVTNNNRRINTTLKRLVANGTLTQTRGAGASGSFSLPKKEPKAAVKPAKKVVKKPAVKAKKPAAKKTAAKKPAAKKPAAKKPAAKKSLAKKAVRKPVLKKSPKKASPKNAVKKPAVKKAPVKSKK